MKAAGFERVGGEERTWPRLWNMRSTAGTRSCSMIIATSATAAANEYPAAPRFGSGGGARCLPESKVIPLLVHSFIFIHSSVRGFVGSCVRSFVHSSIHSFIRRLIFLFF